MKYFTSSRTILSCHNYLFRIEPDAKLILIFININVLTNNNVIYLFAAAEAFVQLHLTRQYVIVILNIKDIFVSRVEMEV